MVVPFGISVGDFIAFVEAAITVVNGFKESTGAAAEYRGVARELESLKLALTELQNAKIEEPHLRAALGCVADNCEKCIVEYLNKTQKYEPYLGTLKGSLQKWKSGLRKIQWTLYSKEDVRKFQMQLYSHTASLNILLQRACQESNLSVQTKQSDALVRIETKIDEDRARTTAFQAAILTTVARCWTEFQALVTLILFSNIRLFNIVASQSTTRIPTQVTFEQPVRFEDAYGRVFPIQMAWIDTWKHFETILKMKWEFLGVSGLGKLEAGQFILSDAGTGKDLERTNPIHRLFRPGRSINMSMTFPLRIRVGVCPACKTKIKPEAAPESQCDKCGLYFTTLKSVQSTYSGTPEDVSDYVEYLSCLDSNLKPELNTKPDSNETLISDFVRVRIFEMTNDTLTLVGDLVPFLEGLTVSAEGYVEELLREAVQVAREAVNLDTARSFEAAATEYLKINDLFATAQQYMSFATGPEYVSSQEVYGELRETSFKTHKRRDLLTVAQRDRLFTLIASLSRYWGHKPDPLEDVEIPTYRKTPWSQREDQTLLRLVQNPNAVNWVKISFSIHTRSPKQCRQRYYQLVLPPHGHNPITVEEGMKIETMVQYWGKNWMVIADALPGRSFNAVRNWWYGARLRSRMAFSYSYNEPERSGPS
ncbi:MAG: hypothetical protein M1820_007912 [Bogoriella megaspora]|nr:MAG: hypothetical protein M1820_007912 [Bogoriella megaspora]